LSDTIKEHMEIIVNALDEYEQSLNLPDVQNPCDKQEIQQYFSMKRDHIEKLSAEDCKQIAYRLSQFAFYIQRIYNREQARMVWATSKLQDVIADNLNNFDKYTKHEMKISLIKKQNKYADSLDNILNYASQREKRLHSLSFSIKNLADIMLANARGKTNV